MARILHVSRQRHEDFVTIARQLPGNFASVNAEVMTERVKKLLGKSEKGRPAYRDSG
jgi:hypothetical protein